MTDYIFPPFPQTSLEIAGSDQRFPVRRIFCVGRNYAAHAREMGKDPTREAPFFFTKPADAIVENGSTIPYPALTKDLHHEIEMVIAISKSGFEITEEAAHAYIFGYAVGIDLTRRDLQGDAKKMGRPWDWGKAFDQSAPCSAIHPASTIGHPQDARIWLSINNEVRQDGNLNELIWSVPEIISILSHSMRIEAGDLIYTGTPAGVGAIHQGDRIEGGVDGVDDINLQIVGKN